MKLETILKSTAAIVIPPSVRVLPTLLRNAATKTPTAPKAGTTPAMTRPTG